MEKIKKVALIAIFLFTLLQELSAQQRVATPASVHPIEAPGSADTTYADLQFLKPLIGGKRFVVIGENHAMGTFLLARNRLVRFLHEQMGFEVVVDESSFYGSVRAWEFAQLPGMGQDDWITALTYTSNIDDHVFADRVALWQYVWAKRHENRPLHYLGMDFYTIPSPKIAKCLEGLIAKDDAGILQDTVWRQFARALGNHHRVWLEMGKPPADCVPLWQAAQPVLARLSGLPVPNLAAQIIRDQVAWACFLAKRPKVWHQTIPDEDYVRDPAKYNHIKWPRLDLISDNKTTSVLGGIRDSTMAANVEWVANVLHRGKKIVILCGLAHAVKKPDQLGLYWPVMQNKNTMSQLLARSYPNELYTIAPAAGGGRYGEIIEGVGRLVSEITYVAEEKKKNGKVKQKVVRRWKKPGPHDTTTCRTVIGPIIALPGSLEHHLRATMLNFAIVDLKTTADWPPPEFVLGSMSINTPLRWSEHWDALLYVRRMNISRRVYLFPVPSSKFILENENYIPERYEKVLWPWFRDNY
jgi:hypothetical protein